MSKYKNSKAVMNQMFSTEPHIISSGSSVMESSGMRELLEIEIKKYFIQDRD